MSVLIMSLGACGGEGRDAKPSSAALSDRARAAQRATGYPLYWVGTSFEGLPLTAVSRAGALTTLVYGDCTPRPGGGDAGCSPPLQIQTASICHRNVLLLDIRPRASFISRGARVMDYSPGRLELATGSSQIVVWSAPARARRAVAALAPVTDRRPSGDRLPEPRYPSAVTDQLGRVRAAYARTGNVRAVRKELHISKSAARFQLALARDLLAPPPGNRPRAAPTAPRRTSCA